MIGVRVVVWVAREEERRGRMRVRARWVGAGMLSARNPYS